MFRNAFLATAVLLITLPLQAQTPQRDGAHDFDFNFGVWHTSITRVLDPFTGSTHTMHLEGTVTVRKVWGGRAQLEEIEADGPKGHWEGLTLFLYNPQSHQWSQNYIGSKAPSLEAPLIGSFDGTRGELIAPDTFEGRSIFVRGTWSNITKDAHRFEEDFSDDGCKTWHPAFIADLTRDKQAEAASPNEAIAPEDASITSHEFDFDLGAWHTHTSRLTHPLTGSTAWTDLDGTTAVHKVWGGRANLAEYKADGVNGPIELLSLRWYNLDTHEWNIDFATPDAGRLGIPGVGHFKDNRLDVYDQEDFSGKSILVRFSIWDITADTARSEQAFSADNGKTWETNWVNKYARTKD